MKNISEVLRMKEQQIIRVKQEIDALRITAKLLGEQPPSAAEERAEIRQVVKLP